MSFPSYPVTAIRRSATYAAAIRVHWIEYVMEALEMAALMVGICVAAALTYSSESPVHHLSLTRAEQSLLMGTIVALATFLIIRSPYGRRTGAHLNPALTLAYLWLGRIHRWDAVNYVVSQFAGALAGVFVAYHVLGHHLSAPPVLYVVTLPGDYGRFVAFVAESLLSALLMGVVLYTTNHRRLTRFSPFFVALITVSSYVLSTSVSGFSVNPARSFSSAFFAWIWHGIWIYFAAPCLGMLTAAAIYVRFMGSDGVYCAKVFHDLESPCPFPCRFHELMANAERPHLSHEVT